MALLIIRDGEVGEAKIRQENGSQTGFQGEVWETRIQFQGLKWNGAREPRGKSERACVNEEDSRFQRQEVMPKAGLFFFSSFFLFLFLF